MRCNLLSQQNVDVNMSKAQLLPKETLESLSRLMQRCWVFAHVNPTTYLLDPFPKSPFKTLYGFFKGELLNIVHCSLQMGVFPTFFKKAVVRPLLRKSNSDDNILDNYRTVSNLPFLIKNIWKAVFIQPNCF